jgi:hypothetical protein
MRRTSYVEGTPSWVDLSTPDIAASSAFYGALFGWKAVDGGPETGGYLRFELDDVPVAGCGPLMQEGQPTFWSTYFSVTNSDATAARIDAAGGRTHVAPMDVMDLGRMAVFTDPTGAAFGTWQAGTFTGAGIVNEPGALLWNELMTRDVPGAVAFYHEAFGVTSKTSAVAEVPYTELQVGDSPVAGIMDISGPQFPAELPPHWMVYFQIADCEAACEKITELGGSVSVPPTDIALGRFAVVADQHGAFFSVMRMHE